MGLFIHHLLGNMVVHQLRAGAHAATNGNAVTFYLGEADRLDLLDLIIDYLRGPWPRAPPPRFKNPSVRQGGPMSPTDLPAHRESAPTSGAASRSGHFGPLKSWTDLENRSGPRKLHLDII